MESQFACAFIVIAIIVIVGVIACLNNSRNREYSNDYNVVIRNARD